MNHKKKVDALMRDEVKLLRIKRRVISRLLELPDNESRERVLGAVSVLLGHAYAYRWPEDPR